MRKGNKLHWKRPILRGIVSFLLIFVMILSMEQFSMVSFAQSQGKVIATSANIRKDADPNSEVVGSTKKDAIITINSQKTASDNTVWYQIYVNSSTLGYIRSDLVEITDGSTPPVEGSNPTPETTPVPETPTPSTDTPSEVTAMEPTSANVTGGESIRVRASASTNSSIVTTAENGLALTVTGQATGTDNYLWYQVSFIANGQEVTGFIRSDYVELSAEPTPPANEGENGENPEQSGETSPSEEKKDYEVQLQEEGWYLLDNINGVQYSLKSIFDTVKNNEGVYADNEETIKNQKAAIIILVILATALAVTVTLLFFKIKDMKDAEYISQVEKETLRKRNGQDSRNAAKQRVTSNSEADKAQLAKAQNGKNTRQRDNEAAVQGNNKTSDIKVAQISQNTRVASFSRGNSGRQGDVGENGTPVKNNPTRQGGMREMGTSGRNATGTRQNGTPNQGRNTQEQNYTGTPKNTRPTGGEQNQGWKSKNFMTDDDEFEFEFLNWDGKEEP